MAETDSIGFCKSCLFWAGDPRLGACHRFPKPQTAPPQHWCGEFKEDLDRTPPPVFKPEEFPVIEPQKKRGRPKKHETEANE